MSLKSVSPLLAVAVALAGFAIAPAEAGNVLTLQRNMNVMPVNPSLLRAALKPKFSCDAGWVGEFPEDIVITNINNYATAAGTVVKYSMNGFGGVVSLPGLKPGQKFWVTGGFHAGNGAPCSVYAI